MGRWPAILMCGTLSAALFLSLFIQPNFALADGWSDNGNFNLKPKLQTSSEWLFGREEWTYQAAFEKSAMGYEFKLADIPKAFAGETQIDQLLSLIASVEAPHREYDAVHYLAKIKPPKKPSDMTVGEIVDWIDATPNQYHAIGRYQVIPATLAYLINAEKVELSRVYDKSLQDQFALRLLKDAGWNKFEDGQMSLQAFMERVARVWAGFPLSNGKSAYDGVAGNRAVITWDRYMTAMQTIFGRG
jgi:hypothetical protein